MCRIDKIMDQKTIYLLTLLFTITLCGNIPQVYEQDNHGEQTHFAATPNQASSETRNSPMFVTPPQFNFEEYQKRTQIDPQRWRYMQQQQMDLKNKESGSRKEKYLLEDQTLQASEVDPVRVQPPTTMAVREGSNNNNWKVIHPKFVTENVKESPVYDPSESLDKQQNLLEKEADMKKSGSYQTISPTSVPVEETSRKARIFKKSLTPNSYPQNGEGVHNENQQRSLQQRPPVQQRQDVNLGNYLSYLNPGLGSDDSYGTQQVKPHQQNLGGFHNQKDHLQALSSLIGKNPNAQLEGLNQLLNLNQQNFQKDHTPIHEDVNDIENPNKPPRLQPQQPSQQQQQQKQQNNQQNYHNLNQNTLQHAILAQTQALQQQGNDNSPQALSQLQEQLDTTAKLHADKIIAQAQQKALEHVQAQHKAIAIAQAQAEKVAYAQIQAQNEELARVHAEAQAKAEEEQRQQDADRQKKEVERQRKLAEDQRRFRERAKAQAHARRLKEEREQAAAEALSKKPPVEEQDAGSVAQKTRLKTQSKVKNANTIPAESQQQYYHHVPHSVPHPVSHPIVVSFKQPKQTPSSYKHETPTYQPYVQSYKPLKVAESHSIPVHSPPESYLNINSKGYNQHTKSEDAEVTKYFVPPQITAEEYKNAKGESDLLYASKYAFGYRIRDYHNGNDFGHEESKDGGATTGNYHVLLPDGRVQNVQYTADDDGFHAKVTYTGGVTSSGISHGSHGSPGSHGSHGSHSGEDDI